MLKTMDKPKILIFGLTYLPYIGGAEVAIKEITSRLDGDFEFDMITCRLDKKLPKFEKIGNINVYRVGNGKLAKYFFPWLAFKQAKKKYKKNNYKIVWSIMATWAGWAGLKIKEKFPEIKYLLTLQSGDSDKFIKKRTWFWHWRYKKIYQKADHIQVISKWLENRARKFGYSGKINLVANGVKIESRIMNHELRKKLNIKEDEKVILTVSRLVEKNGVEDLIQSFPQLLNFLISQLLIIGDGPLRSKLESLVKKLDLEDKVKFLGKLDFKETQKYYSIADIFCRPSLSEGFGNVFIEAMAAGVPVIATPVGGIVDFLKDKETGWFCKVKNPKSIAEKINYILDEKNKNEVKQIVANAKKMVGEKYSWEKISLQMKKIFTDLI